MKIKRTLSVVFALTLPICAAACSGPQQQEESEVLPLWQQSEPYIGTHIYNIAETDEWLVRGGVCDYVIVLGPEGGDGGGTLVCEGTPEEVAACPGSYTGQFLAPVLKKSRRVEITD